MAYIRDLKAILILMYATAITNIIKSTLSFFFLFFLFGQYSSFFFNIVKTHSWNQSIIEWLAIIET